MCACTAALNRGGQKPTFLRAQIQNEGMAAIKNAATHFSTEAYFQNRTAVEDALFGALQARLSQMHVRVPQMFLVRA